MKAITFKVTYCPAPNSPGDRAFLFDSGMAFSEDPREAEKEAAREIRDKWAFRTDVPAGAFIVEMQRQ